MELSHKELSLLLFALCGGELSAADSFLLMEADCPVADKLRDMIKDLPPEKQLAHHLSGHMRLGLIECGLLDLRDIFEPGSERRLSADQAARLGQFNERLRRWKCHIELNQFERGVLYSALDRVPRSCWLAMPLTLWRLKRKLKKLH
jgi:hypothetical protein